MVLKGHLLSWVTELAPFYIGSMHFLHRIAPMTQCQILSVFCPQIRNESTEMVHVGSHIPRRGRSRKARKQSIGK